MAMADLPHGTISPSKEEEKGAVVAVGVATGPSLAQPRALVGTGGRVNLCRIGGSMVLLVMLLSGERRSRGGSE